MRRCLGAMEAQGAKSRIRGSGICRPGARGLRSTPYRCPSTRGRACGRGGGRPRARRVLHPRPPPRRPARRTSNQDHSDTRSPLTLTARMGACHTRLRRCPCQIMAQFPPTLCLNFSPPAHLDTAKGVPEHLAPNATTTDVLRVSSIPALRDATVIIIQSAAHASLSNAPQEPFGLDVTPRRLARRQLHSTPQDTWHTGLETRSGERENDKSREWVGLFEQMSSESRGRAWIVQCLPLRCRADGMLLYLLDEDVRDVGLQVG